jgi:hypothetical protein
MYLNDYRTSIMSHDKTLLFGMAAVLLVFVTTGCGTGDGKTTLDARFLSEPQGGEYVQEVSAELELNRRFKDKSSFLQSSASPEDITVRIMWVFEPRTDAGPEVVESERVTVSSDRATYSTSYSAGSGNVLLNYWSVRIEWTDDEGTHTIESDKALCTAPNSSSSAKQGNHLTVDLK